MTTLPLRIRHQATRAHVTAAWLLRGRDPATWLTELITWDVPLESLRLYPLPKSREDRTVASVLVVPQVTASIEASHSSHRVSHDQSRRSTAELGRCEHASATSFPYGVLAERLYLPVDAVLQPPLDDRELEQLFSPDMVVYVFHPTIGLIGFDEASVLRVRDLMSLPHVSTNRWEAARPGVTINGRLVSIALADPPSLASILEAAQDDIGSQSSSISQLPPTPHEASNGLLQQWGRSVVSGFAKALLRLTSLAPNSAAQPTWVDALRAWADSKLTDVSQAIDSIRNQEIRRLLDLLENHPDEGLRYAIPLDGPAHRGTAPSTNYLDRHATNFDLSRLGGGLAGDAWQIERRYHEQLRKSYRELAAREVRLGRHRRAAYIYAELLYDLPAAAATLKDGGHHRDAAVLFRDRLNRPRDAALCLEDGGLWGEALGLWEELREHERVGDLRRRLDQPEEALDAYRLAVDAHTSKSEFLAAARILEVKMHQPEQAIAALEAGCPYSDEAGHCLQALFELFARWGRHDNARDRVQRLGDQRHSLSQAAVVAATLAKTANVYPSDEVRALAADACRVIVGRGLPAATGSQQRQLLQSLAQLASEDRLLQRDCNRFGRRTVEPVMPRPSTAGSHGVDEPELIATFELRADIQWRSIVAANDLFYAAGIHQNRTLLVMRGNWNGQLQAPQRNALRLKRIDSRILLAPHSHDSLVGWLHGDVAASESVLPQLFSSHDSFPTKAALVATPSEHDRVVAIARGPSGVGWILSLECDGPCLAAYTPENVLIRSIPLLSWTFAEQEEITAMMHVTHEAVYVASGTKLLRVGSHGVQTTESFNAPITSLAGTMPHTRTRVAVGFQHAGYVLWPGGGDGGDAQLFGQDLSDFVMCFTKGGALVAVSAAGGEVYSTHDGSVQRIAKLRELSEPPLAVLPTAHLKQFAVFTRTGAVRVYRLP